MTSRVSLSSTSAISLWAAMLVLTGVRLWLALSREMTPAEALALLRADHWELVDAVGGGLSLWLLKLPMGNPLWQLRWSGPLLALLVSWLTIRGVRRVGLPHAVWVGVTLNFLPVFNRQAVGFSPELLAMAFGLLGFHAFWSGLHQATRWPVNFALAGIAWGLGTLSHGSGAAFPLLAVGFLLATRRWRSHLWRCSGLMMLVDWLGIGLVPYFWWNHQHFQLGWGLWWEASRLALGPAEYAVCGVVGVSPIFLFAGLCGGGALARCWWAGLGLVVVCGFLGIPIVVLFSVLLPVVAVVVTLLLRESRMWLAGLAVAAVCSFLAMEPDLLRPTLLPTYAGDPSAGELGWRTTAVEVEKICNELTASQGQLPVIIADTAETAAMLECSLANTTQVFHAVAGHPRVHCVQGPRPSNIYSFWPRYDDSVAGAAEESAYVGRPAIYVTQLPVADPPPSSLVGSFRQVSPLLIWEPRRLGIPLRRITAWLCLDYEELRL